jgi:hypothetical protein
MRVKNWGILVPLVLAACVAVAETPAPSTTVDCNQGQSISAALAKLNKQTPNTVTVSGTCTEYIQVIGFENLTLQGLTGATLVEPSTGTTQLGFLFIGASRSVTIDGFSLQASTTGAAAIAIGHGSTDIRLRHLNITGGSSGISIFEQSQVSIAYVTAQDPGFTTLGVYDLSDVHLERSLFQNTSGAQYHVGLFVGASHITMYGTTINNMQVGIDAYAGSIIDVLTFTTYYQTSGSTDVVINNSAGTSYNGVTVDGSGSLNVTGAKLLINKPGQTYGGYSGGVLLTDDSSMTASNGYLVITGSNGQGVMALDNSHATLIGATITGGSHGGLVATNLSSIDVSAGANLTLVGGNSVDLFCDPNSMITGSANLSGVPTSQCANLLSGETVALP